MAEKQEWLKFIEELKQRNDIVDVVNGYVPLTQKGKTHWACCPFHHEKTPSFSVNRSGQFFKCYGCGKGGDVITFVQEIDSLTFMEAVQLLAKRVGMEVPHSYRDSETELKKKQREQMYAICKATAQFYHRNLQTPAGSGVLQYLNRRGLDKSTVVRFGLGASCDWRSLPAYLKEKGFDLALAKECGVIDQKDGRYYDFLAERMIVPVINVNGDVIAFGGRTLEAHPKFAKYKNTAQTPLFDKSRTLFGLNNIKKLKTQQPVEALIVVEGYMDVLALYQAGIFNVVASMGTSLTTEQARLIKRFVNEVYISYDGDAAGQNATLRGLDILKEQGLDVRVVSLPEGLDPDEIIKKYGAEKYRSLLQSALPLVDYKISLLAKMYDLHQPDVIRREEARRRYTSGVLSVLKSLSDAVERESYLQQLQRTTNFSLDFLRQELFKNLDPAVELTQPESANAKWDATKKALNFIAACMVYHKEFARMASIPRTEDEFLQRVFEYVAQCRKEEREPIPSMLYQELPQEFRQQVDDLLSLDTTFSTTLEDKKYFEDCQKVVQGLAKEDRLQELYRAYGDEPDQEKKKQILAEIARMAEQKKQGSAE